jgi:glycosyltransferase involved in cell wall biosynthesis
MYDILVSIIVSIYNVQNCLEKCIQSIVNQTYRNLQIILVDDGSEDESLEICYRFAKEDKRILVLHKANGGVVSARKYGAKYLKGEYILTVDGDDWIDENRVYHFVEEVNKSKSQMVYLAGYYKDFTNHSIRYMDYSKEEIYDRNQTQNAFISQIMRKEYFFHPNVNLALWSWGIHSELYKKNQMYIADNVSLGEEIPCVLMCLAQSDKISVINEAGYHYTQRTTSMTNTANKRNMDAVKVWSKCCKKVFCQLNLMRECECIYRHYYINYLLTINYEFLFLKYPATLFPYSKVTMGSRIVVYGAGKFGRNFVNTILKWNATYKIVLWVDKESGNKIGDLEVSEIKKIRDVEFDYVVIAAIFHEISSQIKKDLIDFGVDREKIAAIDADVINKVNMEDIDNYV